MGESVPRDRVISLGHVCESKADFTELLRRWYDTTHEETIGDGGAYGGRAWVWIHASGERCHLNADSTRAGIKRYLELAREHGPDLPWHVIANNRGRVNKIAVEPAKVPTPGLFLYVAAELATPATL